MVDSLYNLFDEVIADALGVSTQDYINKIDSENVSEDQATQIIFGILDGDEQEVKDAIKLYHSI